MADAAEIAPETAPPKKKGMKGLIVAVAGAAIAGGGAFYASYSGLLDPVLAGGDDKVMAEKGFSFLPLDPILVSLGTRANARTLRFTAQLEVQKGMEEHVAELKPRVLDVLNEYLRAVEEAEVEKPGGLTLLRAQMLRRISIVVGEGAVRDLLITEFILS